MIGSPFLLGSEVLGKLLQLLAYTLTSPRGASEEMRDYHSGIRSLSEFVALEPDTLEETGRIFANIWLHECGR